MPSCGSLLVRPGARRKAAYAERLSSNLPEDEDGNGNGKRRDGNRVGREGASAHEGDTLDITP
jgi:hypothetical protein